MTMYERNDSNLNASAPLAVVWESALGMAAEGLIEFLQTLNDELDTQPEPTHRPPSAGFQFASR